MILNIFSFRWWKDISDGKREINQYGKYTIEIVVEDKEGDKIVECKSIGKETSLYVGSKKRELEWQSW